jgi:hypothetical protein
LYPPARTGPTQDMLARRAEKYPMRATGESGAQSGEGPSATRTDDNGRTSRPSFGRRFGKKSWRSPRACSPPSFGVVQSRQGQVEPAACGRTGLNGALRQASCYRGDVK